MVYETSEGPRFLTGPLTDAQVPTVTFATQNRYVALANTDAQIFDTQTWTELTIPGAARSTTSTKTASSRRPQTASSP